MTELAMRMGSTASVQGEEGATIRWSVNTGRAEGERPLLEGDLFLLARLPFLSVGAAQSQTKI